ncbi:MAG: 5-formyltetrahydrofolate cyclo-ligase [Gammaproteobacteria bacterium]|nr:5-formyltetrahydrofolate cyclo-ligase [Gammaproteobacteria bacterium]
MNNANIRLDIKNHRSKLTAENIADASVEIAQLLWKLPVMMRAQRIGCYFAVGGEVDCELIIAEAWMRSKKTFLPILNSGELKFSPYRANTEFLRNIYGIPEPCSKNRELKQARELDVILMPLVSFDDNGNRLGMGGGYYDRTLRFMRNRRSWYHPKLIGLAYDFQKSPQIKAFSWDIALHHVITETHLMNFSRQ